MDYVCENKIEKTARSLVYMLSSRKVDLTHSLLQPI